VGLVLWFEEGRSNHKQKVTRGKVDYNGVRVGTAQKNVGPVAKVGAAEKKLGAKTPKALSLFVQ